MKLVDIYNLFAENYPIMLVIVLVLMTVVEFTPIKINPWGKLLRLFGRAINAEVTDKVDTLDKTLNEKISKMAEEGEARDRIFGERIDVLEQKLDGHIAESDERDVRLRRESILDFASAVANGRNYTKEQYEQMLKECDDYELYCEKKKFKNSVATASMAIIQKSYENHLMNHDFLSNRFSVLVEANMALADDEEDTIE